MIRMIFRKISGIAVAFLALWLLAACSDGVVLVPDGDSDTSETATNAEQGFAVEADQPVLVADPSVTQEPAETEQQPASDQPVEEQPSNDVPAVDPEPSASESVEFVPAASEPEPVAFAPSEPAPDPVVFTPAEPVATKPEQSESSPGESTAGESTAGESTAGESTAGESTAGESTAGESTAGESTAGESTAGESTAGESTAGESTAGESTAGESTAGESTAGESTAGESTAGESTPGESTPGESTPGESTPVVSTPVEPTTVEPTPTEPLPVEPTPMEPEPVEPTPTTSPAPVPISTVPESPAEPVTPEPPQPASPAPPPVVGNHYEPQVLVTWQMQLSGVLDTTYDAELYIVDLFNISSANIESIQSDGTKVICSFSAGTYEITRPDANLFTNADVGASVDGWPGQRWVNIKNQNVRDIMIGRLNLAKAKGCDGVDTRNVDGYLHETGFELTDSDQLLFTKVLSGGAHGRGLAIGLRNDAGRAYELEIYYDFTVNESCDVSDQCDELDVFVANGKPVLHVEYRPELLSSPVAFRTYCQSFNSKQFSTLILPAELNNEFRLSCQE